MNTRHEGGTQGLRPAFSPLGMWAFSIGTSIGWGSFIVTCNTYLQKAGILGTILGLLAGMAVILVITWNLQYMICKAPGAGGLYTFERQVSGGDVGFLAAWFILLTYIAILWANVTSLPLFARFFLGKLFQFGFHYTILGYEVYLGEALLSIAALVLIGLLCYRSVKIPHRIMTVSALVFAIGFSVCAIWAMIHHTGSGYSYEPLYASGSSFRQIVRIAAISPWAFIGFENISHFSEEYTFPVKKIRRILITSVILTTVLYLFVSLLSISAYPPEYATWLDYIRDMGNLEGIKAVPAFYAASHYLGNTGLVILMLALFAVILTSLIGNLMALSRLLYAAGRNGEAPKKTAELNKHGIPGNAVIAVVLLSVFIPFLGRTTIGWIVDVTTLGATIIYGLVSHGVYRHAKRSGDRTETITGMIGIILMFIFVALLLIPNLLSFSAMETESYLLFAIWAILGLGYFRWLIHKDKGQNYGTSIIVWVILLLLVLFASMMWVSRQTEAATNEAVVQIYEFHESHAGSTAETVDSAEVQAFLQSQASEIQKRNALYTIVSFALFFLSTGVMMNNFRATRRLGQKLNLAQRQAVTDHLTGVKNRLSYAQFEEELNEQIEADTVEAFGVVVCDINNLKSVNDSQGHDKGDEYIRNACRLICNVFDHSPVFRIGGDEFAVLLKGHDYEHRHELMKMIGQENEVGRTMAAGMAEYERGEDESVLSVFTRADRQMYQRKKEMKAASL